MFTLKDLTLKSNIFYIDEMDSLDKLKKKLKPCKKHSGACLDNIECTNFIDNMECPLNCKKKGCKNRRIGTDLGRFKLEQKQYSGKGYGIRTLEEIPAGSFVLEYVGFVRTGAEYTEMWENHPGSPFYGMEYDDEYVIDATKEGNLSRLFSHSCLPTLKVQQWYSDSGFPRIIFVAIENIGEGDELTYDYNAVKFKGSQDMECKCGKLNCKYAAKQRQENSEDNKFTCSICPSKFGSKYALKRHENSMHNNKKEYACSQCKINFSRKDVLKRHVQSHASNVKPYKCEKCNKQFRLKHHLAEHGERHLHKGKIYVCGRKRLDKNKTCKKEFLGKKSLQFHRRKEHRC